MRVSTEEGQEEGLRALFLENRPGELEIGAHGMNLEGRKAVTGAELQFGRTFSVVSSPLLRGSACPP